MRVKNLNATRKHKLGEDDGVLDGYTSPTDSTVIPSTATIELPLPLPMMTSDNNIQSLSWREQVDQATRELLHQKIVDYLKALKPNAPSKVLVKLPGLAYRMEETLLTLASTIQEYSDQATLPQRLTLIQQANAKRLLQQQAPVVSPKDKEKELRHRHALNEDQARVVFSCLQSWRQKLVNMYGATPWEILPNQVLAKVAVFIPSTLQELSVCGLQDEQLQRFGSSLLQEIQKIVNALQSNNGTSHLTSLPPRSPSPATIKRPSTSKATTKRDAMTQKKRKTMDIARSTTTTAGYNPSASYIAPAPVLLRPMEGGTATQLPALLPSGPLPSGSTASNANKPSYNTTTTSPFFGRGPTTHEQDNRMHLLAQGAGQVSQQKQGHVSFDMYVKEIQSLRWLLQESQREKAQMEEELQRLRQQVLIQTTPSRTQTGSM